MSKIQVKDLMNDLERERNIRNRIEQNLKKQIDQPVQWNPDMELETSAISITTLGELDISRMNLWKIQKR